MNIHAGSTDQELQELIRAARAGELRTSDIATLARALANSGHVMTKPKRRTADVASTGGPASLSTLLCPLFLTALGWHVPKLGVPGRPAGGLDVLSQIPGYRVHLSASEVETVMATCGYAHFAAGDQLAPLDARLFALRQRSNAQMLPPLVIASILAKKLAVGVETFGLDVRVAAHGNFGSDMSAARKNATLLCHVARSLEIHATCFLTDASRPYQPYIGRGEALLALFRLFSGTANSWLQRHADQCNWLAYETVNLPPSSNISSTAYGVLSSNIRAQGASIAAFEDAAKQVEHNHKHTITAVSPGFPTINLPRLRRVIVERQRISVAEHQYPDPVGVILLVEDTQLVSAGEPLMTIRADPMSDKLLNELSQCLVLSRVPPSELGETIRG